MTRAATRLSDGRELLYYGDRALEAAGYPDMRELPSKHSASQLRRDELLGEQVIVASHRQNRTNLPSAADCPLCPSSGSRQTEIPAPDYEVAVFENRFPALSDGLGRCEVMCFSEDHDTSFARLSPSRVATVVGAWSDRTVQLSVLPGVRQVYCFENRGPEIGATIGHPHGQIYAYPFVTPRTARMMRQVRDHRKDTGRNLFDDVVARERAARSRIVLEGRHWICFVPYAARWPYEVHLYPKTRVPDLPSLHPEAGVEFCDVYPAVLRAFERLFDTPAPYISAWHQAPEAEGKDDFALHLELFSMRRSSTKLKYLAGSESGMDVFSSDIPPEIAAETLKQLVLQELP